MVFFRNLSVIGRALIIMLVIFFISFALATSVIAQEEEVNEKKVARQAKKQKKLDEGKFMMTPLAGPAYTPELGFLIAFSAMMSYKTNPKDSLIQRSSSPTTISITSTGAITGSSKISTFWFQDKMRIYADLWVKDMPDNYWGVGYDNGRNVNESDSTTAYRRLWYQINPRFLWQFKKHYFVGLNADVNYTQGRDESPGVLEDPDYQNYNESPFNSGIGLILQYDSRDMPVNAWSGHYINFSATTYSESLGGDNDYQLYLLDLRKYFNIKRKGRTLAVQAMSRIAVGDVPYGEMSQIGTPFDLRGYTWGRYRDKSMLFFMGEYRHMFQKKNEELSPHGCVAWLAAGSIADNVGEFKNWLPNFGVGYRYEIQPRMNIRFDIGVGQETMGVYFNFNEAF